MTPILAPRYRSMPKTFPTFTLNWQKYIYYAVFDDTNHADVPELRLEATQNNTFITRQLVGSPSNSNTTVSERA